MQRFQELLTQAAQLKQSQLKIQRKNYQSLPDYIKTGLNYAKKFEILRKQNFLIQMNMSQKLKKEGNNSFKKQQYDEALSRYEQALSIFRYISSKSYQNMKDEDLEYFQYTLNQSMKKYEQQYQNHLLALYLNICSCLTKKNKKEDAIHAADQALKIKETAKAYYKKAQAYLQFINREAPDIKLGFYYLNKCYQLSKDASIIQEMHRIKKQLDEQRTKQKTWFKFMFDKNSQSNPKTNEKQIVNENKDIKQQKRIQSSRSQNIRKLQQQKIENEQKQDEKLEKTKDKLAKYLNLDLKDQVWLECYQAEFITKHGSKIYSIIQLYGYKDFLGEYRALLAHSLELKKEGSVDSRRQAYKNYFQWLKTHPIDQIIKYLRRYELQTKWIREQRKKLMEQRQRQDSKFVRNLDQKLLEKAAKSPEQQLKPSKQQINQQITKENQDLEQKQDQAKILQSIHEELNEIKVETKPHQNIEQIVQPLETVKTTSLSSTKIKYLSFAIALVIIITIKFLL